MKRNRDVSVSSDAVSRNDVEVMVKAQPHPRSGRMGYFDFIAHYGGAQRSTVELIGRIREEYEIGVFDAFGGCVNFREEIARVAHRYVVLCPGETKQTIGHRDSRVRRYAAIGAAIPQYGRVIMNLRRALCAYQPEFVWTSSKKALAALVCATSSLDMRVAYFARGSWGTQRPGRLLTWLLRNRAERVLVLAERIKDDLASYGICPDRIFVVPNAVDVPSVELALERTGPSELPVRGAKTKILLPGTITGAKGHKAAILAIGSLVRDNKDVVLYFAGHVAATDRLAVGESLKRLARELGVEERVIFLGWRDDVFGVMNEMTLVILPSEAEGMPRVVMEAMALGIPVAATAVGGVTALIEDGVTGFVIDGDVPASICTIVKKCERVETRNSIGLQGKERVQRLFSPERQVSAFRSAIV